MDKKCPCENCIVFAICKEIMNNSCGIYSFLSDRCSLIKDYFGRNYYISNSIERATLRKIFKPERLEEDV